MLVPLAFQMPGFGEMLLLALLGVILFGKRLPEVGRSLGKGIVEFKKGIKGIEDDVDLSASGAPEAKQFPPQTYTQQFPAQPNVQQTGVMQPGMNSAGAAQAGTTAPGGTQVGIAQSEPMKTAAMPHRFDPYTGKPIETNQNDSE